MNLFLTAAASTLVAISTGAAASVSLVAGTGNPSFAVTGGSQIGFEDVAPGTYDNLTTGGVAFSAAQGTAFEIADDYSGQFNNQGQTLQGSFASSAFQSLMIAFTAPVQAFAFNYGGADTNWTLEAFDVAGQTLGSVTLLPTHAANDGTFYGIASSGQDIASALLSVDFANYNPATLHPDYIFLDNVTIGQFALAPAVPESSEWAMMSLGLGIVGMSARRRARRGGINR